MMQILSFMERTVVGLKGIYFASRIKGHPVITSQVLASFSCHMSDLKRYAASVIYRPLWIPPSTRQGLDEKLA